MKNRIIFHIDFNSYFATVEQQANPRLRGKPIGVTGGDRVKRTVIGAASVEAKKFGLNSGMPLWEARKLCPNLILVQGDSDKYLETTKRFLNILKDYSPYLEVFSIDEVFMELPTSVIASPRSKAWQSITAEDCFVADAPRNDVMEIAQGIKSRICLEVGEWIRCSIGISYNKLIAKLAGSLYKPDGLVVIADEEAAQWVLDRVELDEICGIGPRIKKRLNNMGIFSFAALRKVPKEILLASFKSYGQILYNMSRGIDNSEIIPFYEKEEVKSVGHRHTIDHDTANPDEIKQILLKLTELVARRLRAKKLVGKTISCWFRYALHLEGVRTFHLRGGIDSHLSFSGQGMQTTIIPTQDGLEIFKAGWKIFLKIWDPSTGSTGSPQASSGQVGKIRMIGVSVSNLKPATPQNLSLLPEANKQEIILKVMDKINDKFGEFTLERGILLGSTKMRRKPNPFLADRRFKL